MSTDRQRDAETDRLLRATLQPGVHAEACPGADILAAYAEGSLSPTERDGLDVHFADCHRCQEALAFMARTWTAPDAAQPSAAGRWWSIRMRWLVPVAAAAVVVMYVAVRPVIAPYFPPVEQASKEGPTPVPQQVMADARVQERGATTAGPDTSGTRQVAPPRALEGKGTASRSSRDKAPGRIGETGIQQPEARRTEPPMPSGRSEGADAGRMRETGLWSPVYGTSGAGRNTSPQVTEAKRPGRAGEIGAPLPTAPETRDTVRVADAAARPAAGSARPPANAINEARPGSPPPAAPPPALASPLAMAPVPPPGVVPAPPPARAATASQPAAVPTSPATPLPAAQLAGAAGASPQQLALKAAAAAPREIRSADGSVVWRIGPGSRLLRSTNRGTTWQTQPSGVSVELLAGSAPSAMVCWVVGRAATIIVTTDGAQWTTRPFPERVDLVAIEATDARSATVTTRDGRRFSTLDGGATWSES